jgi:hypothetical protein
MIHQLIFAHPKPGMSEQAFQDYWVKVHAVEYASKIPQIKRYLVDTRVPCGAEPDDPLFSGVAEIWLENEEEQLASLQCKEFLQGARVDEPRWAAYWQTLALDTTTHVIMDGPPISRDSNMVKWFILVKRTPGMPLHKFRSHALENHAIKTMSLPGLRRYYQCHVQDSCYSVGESPLDAVFILWFDNVSAIEAMWTSVEYREIVAPGLAEFVDPKYRHTMAAAEHWIIGPALR